MDRDLFNPQRDMGGQNLTAFDQVSSHINSSPLTESQPSDINNQCHFEPQYSTLPRVHGEPISNFHDEIAITNYQGACETTIDSLLPITRRSRTELREHLTGGLPVSPTLSGVLLTTSGLHESLNDLTVPEPSVSPSELLRTYILSDCSNTSSSSYASSLECVYDRTQGDVHNRWDFKKFPLYADLSGETACFQPPQLIGNLDSGEWNKNDGNVSADDPYRSSEFTNDLSLSLASSQPSVICGPTIPDQCSEIICSNANQNSCNQMRFSSEQASCSNKEVSLCSGFGSYRSGHMSQPSSVWSRYLFAIQEILSEIASLTLNNTEQMSCSTSGFVSEAPLTDEAASVMEFDKFPDGDIRFEVRMEPMWPTQEAEARKEQMLDLLRVVDYQYNRFLDEIHTVTSAFHAATELNPQIHSRFALRNLSFLYKNLRERISNQILAMGTHISGEGDRRGKNKSFESSFMQREWTIQQLKRKEHQLWRPQRGLPERSVSVLRAWMFQNFLHPYPKDAEKHILAVKSGLTRSQVSNWFINARVRLWKPLIEEMYAEVDRRKAHPNSMKYQGFRLN